MDKAESKFDEAMNAYDRFDNEDESTANSSAIENPQTRAQKEALSGVNADDLEAVAMAPPEILAEGDNKTKKRKSKKSKKAK